MKQTVIPIYVDETKTPRDYKEYVGRETLLVTSVFPTLQGEGPFTGMRSVFVRLAGCNFGGKAITGPGCSWCDSDFRFSKGTEYTYAGLIHEIKEKHPGPSDYRRLVVITGGEPMLQRNLIPFIRQLYADEERSEEVFSGRWRVQIESNGTYLLDGLPESVYLVVSPKAPENPSTGKAKYASLPSAVFDRADCLKILVSSDPDSPYHKIPDFAYEFSKEGGPVYLSPINIYKNTPEIGKENIFDDNIYDLDAIQSNHAYAAQLCLETGFLLNAQTHLFCTIP